MIKFGIIGAMQEEITSLLDIMEDKKSEKFHNLEFFTGRYKNVEMVVVRCGVGKVNAAMCTQALIDRYSPDYVINIGVAGAIDEKVDICDIVLSTYLVEHDFDCTAFGYEMGVIPRLKSSRFKADDYLLELAGKAKKSFDEINFFDGVIVSGDIFVNSNELKDVLKKRHDAYCAEMEGASIAHVCTLNEVPFLVIRSMSDKADGDSPDNFDEFVIKSAENSRAFIQEMIKNI